MWMLFRDFVRRSWRLERGVSLSVTPLAPVGRPIGRPGIVGDRYDDELCNFIELDLLQRADLRWSIRAWGTLDEPRPVTHAQLIFIDGGVAPMLRALVDGSADAVSFTLPELSGGFELLVADDLAAGNVRAPKSGTLGRKDSPAKGRPRKRWLVLVRDALASTDVAAAELAKAHAWKRTKDLQGNPMVTIGDENVPWDRFAQHVSRERKALHEG